MARNAELVQRRNKAIRADFEKLRGIRNDKGLRKYTYEYAVYMLSEKYYIAQGTIEHIIDGRR
jgi:hypothetical protein